MVDSIKIFTDGSCIDNKVGSPGGYGAVIQHVKASKVIKEYIVEGYVVSTTNNRMELQAVISSLEKIPSNFSRPIVITTDSKYVKDGITSWIKNWKKNGWKTAANKPVKNKDMWTKLDSFVGSLDVSWEWVKGHMGHRENEMADKIAGKQAQIALREKQKPTPKRKEPEISIDPLHGIDERICDYIKKFNKSILDDPDTLEELRNMPSEKAEDLVQRLSADLKTI